MNQAIDFVQAAGEPLRRARSELQTALAGLAPEEAFLQLRLDFEEILHEDHGVDPTGSAVIFGPLEELPTMEDRLEQLLHMASSYVVAREFGLVKPSTAPPDS